MHYRFLALSGLALCVTAGCQSYYPYGYGPGSMYSAFPQGTYVPSSTKSGGVTSPTPVDGKKNLQPTQGDDADGTGSKAVPEYKAPKGAPDDLGAQSEEDDSGINKKRRDGASRSVTSPVNSVDDEELISSTTGDQFVRPVEHRDDGEHDTVEPRRLTSRSKPSPYKKDPRGYSWLTGVVSRDRISKMWQITYNRDHSEKDKYGGVLTLADDESLDTLVEGDVIRVEGTLDRQELDRFDKPCYRVERLTGPFLPQSK